MLAGKKACRQRAYAQNWPCKNAVVSRIGEGGGKAILLIYMKSKTAPIIVALLIPIVSVAVALSLIYFKKKNVSGLDEFPYSVYIFSRRVAGQ